MLLSEVGMDEVGRGAMAGPLVAAAVALSAASTDPIASAIVDSKLLTPERRQELDAWIRTHAEIVAIEAIGVDAINALGIGWANRMVFARLMRRLGARRYIVDGNLRLQQLAPQGSVVVCRCGGDRRSRAVAAASIVAKVYRDRLMESLHDHYPAYGWAKNAGYATADHRRAVRRDGPCDEHRILYLRRLLAEEDNT